MSCKDKQDAAQDCPSLQGLPHGPLLVYVLDQVRRGTLTLDTSPAVYPSATGAYTLYMLLSQMATEPEGPAAQTVLSLLNLERLNEYIHDTLGLHSTGCTLLPDGIGDGYTTATDLARLDKLLQAEQILTEPLRMVALELLSHYK